MVVDDDLALARMLRILFQSEGYEVMLAHDGQQALDKLTAGTPALVVLDTPPEAVDPSGGIAADLAAHYHLGTVVEGVTILRANP